MAWAKSKVCAALLELAEPKAPPAGSKNFADKRRLLEHEQAEAIRNFTCYNHMYAQSSDAYTNFSPKMHVIDTPGHVDRLPHVDLALRAAHGAVMVVRAGRSAVDASSARILDAVKQSGRRMVFFLNGIDQLSTESEFTDAVDCLEEHLGKRPVTLWAPAITGGPETSGMLINVVDGTLCSPLGCSTHLFDNDAWSWYDREQGSQTPSLDDSGAVGAFATRLRAELIDVLAETNDAVMEAYLESDGDVPTNVLHAALRSALQDGSIMPLVAGSAKSGLGVDVLQDIVKMHVDVDDAELILQDFGIQCVSHSVSPPKQDESFLGLVFGQRKIKSDLYLEVRVLDGLLKPNAHLKTIIDRKAAGSAFEPAHLLQHGPGGHLVHLEVAGPGDLVLVQIPVQQAPTGHTEFLVSGSTRRFTSDDSTSNLSKTHRGRCTFNLDLSKLDRKDKSKLIHALETIQIDDEGFCLDTHKETGETFLSCSGMLHLQLVRERLQNEFKIMQPLTLGEPYVDYHATVLSACTATGKHEPKGKTRIRKGIVHEHTKQADAWARVRIEALNRGSGVVVDVHKYSEARLQVKDVKEQEVQNSADALEEGIRSGLQDAGPGGVPLVDVKVEVVEAEVKNAESAADAAADAVHRAVQTSQALAGGKWQKVALLEPMVEMEVDVPISLVDEVINDFQKRHAEQVFVRPAGGDAERQVVDAVAPLRSVVRYQEDLKKLAQGQGSYTFHVKSYREMAHDTQNLVMDKLTKA